METHLTQPYFNFMIKQIFIALIRLYQLLLSPLIGSNCRFQPTCSQYAIDAFKEFSTFKAILISINRIRKCHPWGAYGYDPIKKKKSC